MEKKIKLNHNNYKNLTFEQVLKMYIPLIKKQILTFQTIYPQYNYEFDDLYQIFSMEVYKVFTRYDISKDIGFGYIVQKYLKYRCAKLCIHFKRNKRQHIDVEIEESFTIPDTKSVEDYYNENTIIKYVFSLPDRDGDILRLRYFKEPSRKEIQHKFKVGSSIMTGLLKRHRKFIHEQLI